MLSKEAFADVGYWVVAGLVVGNLIFLAVYLLGGKKTRCKPVYVAQGVFNAIVVIAAIWALFFVGHDVEVEGSKDPFVPEAVPAQEKSTQQVQAEIEQEQQAIEEQKTIERRQEEKKRREDSEALLNQLLEENENEEN